MMTIDAILEALLEYNPKADKELVVRSFEYCAKAHAGQTRRSGEPYLIHPLEVAKILTQLKMDVPSIIAAILHDTIEDTQTTKDEISKLFGKEVAEIVDGVTKISKIAFSSQFDQQAENYRKMILAMSKDIRVILVKLADRLNNMRTLQFMPESKQVRISTETLDIFAPIAGRMGIYWIKEELEELSLKFLKPEIHAQIQSRTLRLQNNSASFIKRVTLAMQEQIAIAPDSYEIAGRVKKSYSIYRKIQRQQVTLDDIHDLLAFRVLVMSVEQCYEVLGSIHTLWKPVQGRFKDYIAMPKANNYQSLHTTVVCFDGERVEFQIRTFAMHEVAEKGIAAHWRYKDGGALDTRDEAKFRWVRQLVDWQTELKDSLEFVDTVKFDLFEDEIFVFTPKGDLMRLAHGSTPVDFAYAVHSDVGHHCQGARVNGRMITLATALESGDSVEIITSKNQNPSKDWLDFVKTSKARAHIRSYIREEQREKSTVAGKNLLEAACQRRGISPAELQRKVEFKKFLDQHKFADVVEFYVALAYGKIMPRDVVDFVSPVTDQPEPINEKGVMRRFFDKLGPRGKNLVLVDQQGDVLVTLGKCCNPVKGDLIVGFVTRGRGVSVHRVDCNRAIGVEPDLHVPVAWNKSSEQVSLARVIIITEDRKGMLAEISRLISDRNVNINKVLIRTQKDGVAKLLFELSVRDAEELRKIMTAIESLKHVLSVTRAS